MSTEEAEVATNIGSATRVMILGSGGGAPSSTRETSCVLVMRPPANSALLLDVGSGARQLLANAKLLQPIEHVDVVLTHFHFDHVCGLPYLQNLEIDVSIWAPGAWLYSQPSAEILAPLLRPPISPNDVSGRPVYELREGAHSISGFELRASAQPRHWTPSVGFRVDDELAYITDTPFERSSIELARGVRHLLHEAWSTSTAPIFPDKDATAADAARVAQQANVDDLTLIHLNRRTEDFTALLDDARPTFAGVTIGEDLMLVS